MLVEAGESDYCERGNNGPCFRSIHPWRRLSPYGMMEMDDVVALLAPFLQRAQRSPAPVAAPPGRFGLRRSPAATRVVSILGMSQSSVTPMRPGRGRQLAALALRGAKRGEIVSGMGGLSSL